jgi:hypothetical protein
VNYLASFFSHSKAVQDAAAPLGIEASMRLSDYSLGLSDGTVVRRWRAKFLGNAGGRLAYTDRLAAGTIGFAGWIPYEMRHWPIARDKSGFKRYAIANGMATPAACVDPARVGGPFIIKKIDSSFGEGLRGPFVGHDARDPAQVLAAGEYYENFIVGHMAKAWCWGNECVALHLHQPTIVTGDGQSTLRELVLQLPDSRSDAHDWDLIGRLATYCGVASVENVLAPGKEVLVEYRYGSRYEVQTFKNLNVMPTLGEQELGLQFSRAAALCAPGIPEDREAGNALYTLDAVIDGGGTAWFLEMNCNPLVHPDAYPHMLSSAFAATTPAAATPSPA